MASPFSITDIQELLEILKKNDVSEFKLDRGDERLWLRRGEQISHVRPQQAVTLVQQPQPIPVQVSAAESVAVEQRVVSESVASQPVVASKNIKEIHSPMVGTFYRRPAVDAEPYVEVGDSIKKGDVLCIIEAMKVMNEIESEITGKIIDVCLEDGQMVEYGEVLFRVETSN